MFFLDLFYFKKIYLDSFKFFWIFFFLHFLEFNLKHCFFYLFFGAEFFDFDMLSFFTEVSLR
jgi:hypothetical protein